MKKSVEKKETSPARAVRSEVAAHHLTSPCQEQCEELGQKAGVPPEMAQRWLLMRAAGTPMPTSAQEAFDRVGEKDRSLLGFDDYVRAFSSASK